MMNQKSREGRSAEAEGVERPAAALTQVGQGLAGLTKPLRNLKEQRAIKESEAAEAASAAEVDPENIESLGPRADIGHETPSEAQAEQIIEKRRRPQVEDFIEAGKIGVVMDDPSRTIFTMQHSDEDKLTGIMYDKDAGTYTMLDTGKVYQPTDPAIGRYEEARDKARVAFEVPWVDEPEDTIPGLEDFDDYYEKRRGGRHERGRATERYIPPEERGLGLTGIVGEAEPRRPRAVVSPPSEMAERDAEGNLIDRVKREERAKALMGTLEPKPVEEAETVEEAEERTGMKSDMREQLEQEAKREAVLEDLRTERKRREGFQAGPEGDPWRDLQRQQREAWGE
jgi:hypothetical protein